jgi:hypothetical protein
MTSIEYGRRAWVPSCCPVCGNQNPPSNGKVDLSLLFKITYFGWNADLRKNDWGMDRWYGDCGRCGMREAMFSDSIFDVVKK